MLRYFVCKYLILGTFPSVFFSDIDSKGHFSIDGCFQTKFMKSKPFFVDVTFEKFLSQNGCTAYWYGNFAVLIWTLDIIKVSRFRFHLQHAYILFKGTERQSVKIIPSGSKGSRFEQGT